MQIIECFTSYTYDELFNKPIHNSIILPQSFLYNEDNTIKFCNKLLENLDPINAICYSSFLNMTSQTYDVESLIQFSVKELCSININPIKQRLLFNRDSLLKVIALLILKNKDTEVITGNGNENRLKKFYQAVSAINTIKNENYCGYSALPIYILRDSPHIHGSPSFTYEFYQRHLKRYWYIYTDLFDKLLKKEKEVLIDGIKCLQENLKLPIKEYFLVLVKILIWFLSPSLNSDIKGFDVMDINTFYIRAENFPNSQLIALIKKISLDLSGMEAELSKNYKSDNKKIGSDKLFQKLFNLFFDYPIFKVNENLFCIIDLRSLMERSCTGFIWTIRESQKSNADKFHALKSQYGNLLESYFLFLLEEIVGEANVVKPSGEGMPDAIIRHKNSNISLIFEFTTEYYTMDSLNNSNKDEYYRKLDEILFNPGKGKGKGKIFNINEYIKDESERNPNNSIITVLVTEKYLGDTELLSLSGYNLKDKIGNAQLVIEMPLILSIDDLEIFWSFLISESKEEIIEELINCLVSWRNEKNKNKFFYNIGFYIREKYTQEEKTSNPDYNNFFNINKLLEAIKTSDQSYP